MGGRSGPPARSQRVHDTVPRDGGGVLALGQCLLFHMAREEGRHVRWGSPGERRAVCSCSFSAGGSAFGSAGGGACSDQKLGGKGVGSLTRGHMETAAAPHSLSSETSWASPAGCPAGKGGFRAPRPRPRAGRGAPQAPPLSRNLPVSCLPASPGALLPSLRAVGGGPLGSGGGDAPWHSHPRVGAAPGRGGAPGWGAHRGPPRASRGSSRLAFRVSSPSRRPASTFASLPDPPARESPPRPLGSVTAP